MIREAGCSRDCTVLSRRSGDRDPETALFLMISVGGPCHAAQPLIMPVAEPSVLPNQLYLPLMIMATAPAASVLPGRIYFYRDSRSKFSAAGEEHGASKCPEAIGVTVNPKQVKR